MDLLSFYKKMLDRIIQILLAIEGILVFCFFVLIFLGTIFRYVLHDSLTWSDQICKIMFIWSVCLGIPITLQKRRHVAFDLLYKSFPEVVRCLIDLIVDGIVVVFAVWLVKYGAIYVQKFGSTLIGGIEIPYWLLYGIEPVTGILILLVIFEHILFICKRLGTMSVNRKEEMGHDF